MENLSLNIKQLTYIIMKTIELKLYSFNELSETAKQKVISDNYNINVSYEWWESIYEDAENIGLKITSFDIDRGNYCNGRFIDSVMFAANEILKSHGETCETYKTANNFLTECQKEKEQFESDIENEDECFEDSETFEDIEKEFLYSLCEDYRILLQKEYDYLTSKQAIIETIEVNEYTFLENGEIFNA